MKITRQTVAGKITGYLHGNSARQDWLTGQNARSWRPTSTKPMVDLLNDIVGRLGLADVAEFGLRWQDCEESSSREAVRDGPGGEAVATGRVRINFSAASAPSETGERSRQPGEKRHIPDWIDRRPEGRKIFADLDQKRRHGKSAFYPDTNDRSSTRKVVASAASPHRTHEMISYRLTILDFARRAGSIRFQGNYKNSSDALFRSIGTCLGPDNARLRAND